MQRLYHEKEGNTEIIKELETKSENFNTGLVYTELGFKSSLLMLFDDELIEQWLNNGLQYGELKAAQMLIDEAIWRSKNPNYTPCPLLEK